MTIGYIKLQYIIYLSLIVEIYSIALFTCWGKNFYMYSVVSCVLLLQLPTTNDTIDR